MIAQLDQVLADTGEPGLPELRAALVRVLDDSHGALLYSGAQRLWSRVFRLQFAARDGLRSVVVKRLGPLEARRGEMVAWRWLPAVGLGEGGPGLLGVAALALGDWVWHVYEDLGDSGLAGRESDTAAVAAAVRLIASVHSRFASHPLLAECRSYRVFDISWFGGNVRDAIRSLEGIRPPAATLTIDQAALRGRLLARLRRLLAEQDRRARALAESGGPETLLHGDLWTSNTFVVRTPEGLKARLIDWDRAGGGADVLRPFPRSCCAFRSRSARGSSISTPTRSRRTRGSRPTTTASTCCAKRRSWRATRIAWCGPRSRSRAKVRRGAGTRWPRSSAGSMSSSPCSPSSAWRTCGRHDSRPPAPEDRTWSRPST
jgi:hypothetical protein